MWEYGHLRKKRLIGMKQVFLLLMQQLYCPVGLQESTHTSTEIPISVDENLFAIAASDKQLHTQLSPLTCCF